MIYYSIIIENTDSIIYYCTCTEDGRGIDGGGVAGGNTEGTQTSEKVSGVSRV